MSELYELGKKAAQRNAPGAYILDDDAAKIVSQYTKGSNEWHDAISEFVNGFATERIRVMGE